MEMNILRSFKSPANHLCDLSGVEKILLFSRFGGLAKKKGILNTAATIFESLCMVAMNIF